MNSKTHLTKLNIFVFSNKNLQLRKDIVYSQIQWAQRFRKVVCCKISIPRNKITNRFSKRFITSYIREDVGWFAQDNIY